MQQIHQFLVLLLPLIFLPLIISVAEVSAAGGWKPIKDPHVIEMAEFAVAEYNKQGQGKGSLKFVAVVSGETQGFFMGRKYRLVLKATDGTATKEYQAIVLEKLWLSFKKLVSFDLIQS
ncbi:hypothetical protein V6N13_096967 [Hibiscus sabdariffa]|uniref:Cystatin domain-containing protein n=2 Tax=Hibiscus sabdariffa TaxID=183260 RepID=A0ABR1ZEF5_9ROSI